MKLIEAFVRTNRADEVIRALQTVGAPEITIHRVHGVGHGYEPRLFTLAPSDYKKTLSVSKVEIVSGASDADNLVQTLATAARTGVSGDGITFVTPVENAIKIRTGVRGRQALSP